MQRRPQRRARTTDTVLLSGWLFADLLLALAVIFLASSNTSAFRAATPTPTPTPTIIPTPPPTATPTPTPAALPRLELNFHPVTLTIDSNGLFNNDQNAINNLKQQIQQLTFLRGRTAGLVIAYDGAPTTDQIPQSQQIAQKVMDVLKTLGNQEFVLRTSYYKPLYNLGPPQDAIEIDIYLFA